MRLILASSSPRRAELLGQIGLPFDVRAANVDESPLPHEPAPDYVVRLAAAKAAAVAAAERAPETLILGADTAVVLDGQILGKPLDRADGIAMLLSLAGRSHRVMTGISVLGGTSGWQTPRSRCVISEVEFRPVERWEAEAYWEVGEAADKAGGYGIQGVGGIFAASIRGSYSAVVGLPLAETEQLLRDCGLDTWHERTYG